MTTTLMYTYIYLHTFIWKSELLQNNITAIGDVLIVISQAKQLTKRKGNDLKLKRVRLFDNHACSVYE